MTKQGWTTYGEVLGMTWRFSTLVAQSNAVIAMRVFGMAGLWSVTPREKRLMVDEKLPAFTEAAWAASRAAMLGRRPDQVIDAALVPLGRKARANSRRLAKRGPKVR